MNIAAGKGHAGYLAEQWDNMLAKRIYERGPFTWTQAKAAASIIDDTYLSVSFTICRGSRSTTKH